MTMKQLIAEPMLPRPLLTVHVILIAFVISMDSGCQQSLPGSAVLAGGGPGTTLDSSSDASRQSRLVLGVNDDGVFHPLHDGDDIEVHRGSQGGIHVLLSLRVEGVSARDRLLVGERLTLTDDNELAGPAVEVITSSFQKNGTAIELLDHLVYLFGSVSTVRNRFVDVEVTVRDPDDDAFDYSAALTLRFVDDS